MGQPLAKGSISLRLYPHALPATARLDELQLQADLAAAAGFDGVMMSERHGGSWGQIPNPLQVAGFLLGAMRSGWAAPCPLLINLRPAPIIAEDLAWLAARFPDRVGAGFGSGGNEADFALVGAPFAARTAEFETRLAELIAILRGAQPHGTDSAIELAQTRPIPLVSMAMSHTAARRAARYGLGIIGSSLNSLDLTRAIADSYRSAGGDGVHVLIRRVWIGEPPRDQIARQLDHYREAAAASGARLSADDEMLNADDPHVIAEGLLAALDHARADALNIRIHVPGISPEQAREQIEQIGRLVVPEVRRGLAR